MEGVRRTFEKHGTLRMPVHRSAADGALWRRCKALGTRHLVETLLGRVRRALVCQALAILRRTLAGETVRQVTVRQARCGS